MLYSQSKLLHYCLNCDLSSVHPVVFSFVCSTCAIRENAEDKVWNRLDFFQSMRNKNRKLRVRKAGYPMVGVLGCMAERLKTRLLDEKSVDFVCGPDAYRDIPRLVAVAGVGQKEANTVLSFEESYADISPVRESSSSHSAFVSIMRGCNNMCTYCIVPFTRGRERSREMSTILGEIDALSANDVKEVTLLGQNVNGYFDSSEQSQQQFPMERKYAHSPGFEGRLFKSKKQDGAGARFADLLDVVSQRYPDIRFRFTSPHPKDFPDQVLEVIARRPNLCSSLHLPAQSGSNTVLARMRREHSVEVYLDLVDRARRIIGEHCGISSDFISGFCGETEEEHQETVALIRRVKYDMAFMFAYSLREKTSAAYKLGDDVPEDVKLRRLHEVIAAFRETSLERVQAAEKVGDIRLVLLDNYTHVKDGNLEVFNANARLLSGAMDAQPVTELVDDRSQRPQWVTGRTDNSHKCLISITPLPAEPSSVTECTPPGGGELGALGEDGGRDVVLPRPGDYVVIKITAVQGKTVYGVPLGFSTITRFHQ